MDLHSIPVEANAGTPPATEEKSKKFRIISALLSSVIPGAGQFLLGRRKIGLVFFFSFLFAGVLFWPIGIPTWFWGLQIVITTSFVFFVVAGWHALRCESMQVEKRSYWWLILILPLSVGATVVHGNWWMRAAGFRPFLVPSTSMEPTIHRGDRIVVDLRRYRASKPVDGELVVYKREGTFYVKRLIATGGETVEGRNGQLFVNGGRLYEPYTQHTGARGFPSLNNFEVKKVPIGKLFVVGDNRDVSYDSRTPDHGLVDEREIAGQALYIVRSSVSSRIGLDLRLGQAQP